MVMREISLYILLGHLFIACVGFECLPVECLRCNTTGETLPVCPPCPINDSHCVIVPSDNSSKCKRDFQVSINSTGSSVEEGNTITLTCANDLPNLHLTFEWIKNGKVQEGQNESKLVLNEVISPDAGQYICSVNSSCGSYKSLPHSVTISNGSVLLLVVCGVSALILVLIMGLVMKLKLKRDNIKHRERMNRRVHIGQSGAPSPITPRES